MKNIVYISLILFFSVRGFSQTTPVPGTTPLITPQNARVAFKLNLQIPYGNDTTLNGGLDSTGSLFFQLKDSSLYVRINKDGTKKWISIFSVTDTTSLSNRINQKVSISDTSSMLSPYVREINAGAGIIVTRIGHVVTITNSGGGGGGGGDSIWIGTTSQLRTLNDANIQSAFTTDNGTGTWLVDVNDIISPDNLGTIIIDAFGRRWKRVWDNSRIYMEWFGVKGDGISNNTLPMQNAVNAAYILKKDLYALTGGRYLFNQINLPNGIVLDWNGAWLSPYNPTATSFLLSCVPLKNNGGIYDGGNHPVLSPNKQYIDLIEVRNANVDLGNSLMGFVQLWFSGSFNNVVNRVYIHDNNIVNFNYRPISIVNSANIRDTTTIINNVDIFNNSIRYNPLSGLALFAGANRGDTLIQVYTIDHGNIKGRLASSIGKYFWIGSNMPNDSLDNTGYTKTNTFFKLKSYSINQYDSTLATLNIQGGAYDSTNGYMPFTDITGIRSPVISNAMVIPIYSYTAPLLFTLPTVNGGVGSTTLTRTSNSTAQNAYSHNLAPGLTILFSQISGKYTVVDTSSTTITITPSLSGNVIGYNPLPATALAPCIYQFGYSANTTIKNNYGYGGDHFVNATGVGGKGLYSEDLDNRFVINDNVSWFNWMTLENQSGNETGLTITSPFSNISVIKGDTSIVFTNPSSYRIAYKDMGSGVISVATLTSITDANITNLNSIAVGDIYKWVGSHYPYKVMALYINGGGNITASIRRWNQNSRSVSDSGWEATMSNIGVSIRLYNEELGQRGSIKYTEVKNNQFHYSMSNAGGTGYHVSWQGYQTVIQDNFMENSEQADLELHAVYLYVKDNVIRNYMFDGSQPMPSLTRRNSGPGRSHGGWGALIATRGYISNNDFYGRQSPGFAVQGGNFLLQSEILSLFEQEQLGLYNNTIDGIGTYLFNVVDFTNIDGINYPKFYYNRLYVTNNLINLRSDFANFGLFRNIVSPSEFIIGNTIRKENARPVYNVFGTGGRPNPEIFVPANYDFVIDNHYDTTANLNTVYLNNSVGGVFWNDNKVTLDRPEYLSNKTLDNPSFENIGGSGSSLTYNVSTKKIERTNPAPAAYANNISVFGTGTGLDTASGLRVDRTKRYFGFGNTSSAPLYDIDLVKSDTLAGTSVVISVTNPAKTSTRYSILRLFDGNDKGLVTSYENGQGYIYTSASEYFYFGTNNAKWMGISPTGSICIGCAVPTNRVTIGKVGNGAVIDFAGNTSGKVTFKFPDTITNYSYTWPSTSSGATVGQAVKVVAVSGTDITLGLANDNTGGGSGASLMGTSY